MKFKFLLLLLAITLTAKSQELITFESFEVPTDSFLNHAENDTFFQSGNFIFPNAYGESDFGPYWSGTAISATRDSLTEGFNNQYSAITGAGFENSSSYAVFNGTNSLIKLDTAQIINGFYITNTTYAALSMQNGDQFAKRFGGETGDDPDFFLLTIKGYSADSLTVDSIDFYLADFRFSDNTEDYIVKNWNYIDVSNLGTVDSLHFTLNSSDVGQFGMNTPAYFAIDNLNAANPDVNTSNQFVPLLGVEVYPNPIVDYLTINYNETIASQLTVFDIVGNLRHAETLNNKQSKINLNNLQTGYYIIKIENKNGIYVQKFLKQ